LKRLLFYFSGSDAGFSNLYHLEKSCQILPFVRKNFNFPDWRRFVEAFITLFSLLQYVANHDIEKCF